MMPPVLSGFVIMHTFVAAILVLQALFVYAPFMHAIFASAPLPAGDVLLSILVGALILPVIGLEKWWRNRG